MVASGARPAAAFVQACHQAISTDALQEGAWPLGSSSPPLLPEEKLLEQELSIDVSPRVTSSWSLSVLIGNQYNDGGSYDPKDFVALAEITARPDAQPAHCLRGPDDDGEAGDASALAACKAFILEQLGAALGDGETPDLDAKELVRLHLVFRGDIDVSLSRYAFHLGQATHALQDSFSHTFRSPDLRQVRSVLNWVDWLDEGYDPARDGFHHLWELDKCGAADVGGLERRAVALEATAQLIAAMADDTGGRAGRLARAGAVVDAWSGIGESCTAANHWCDAPEQKLTTAGCALAPTPGRPDGKESLMVITAMAIMGCWRRRARRAGAATLAALVVLGLGGQARAADADPGKADRGETTGNVVAKATPEEQAALESRPFGLLVRGGFSLDDAGYNVGVGARYDLGRRWTVGLGIDYSPWLSLETSRATKGTTNVFGVGVFRLDVRDYLELRITGEVGVSVLMFDTYAAKKGSVGPYFAISPLGVGFRMTRHLRLLVDPAELVLSVPQTTGIPLAYREHRFSVAMQVNF